MTKKPLSPEQQEKRRAYLRRWRDEHREHCRAYDKREHRREQHRAENKRWYEAHQEQVLARRKRYYQDNHDRIKEQRRARKEAATKPAAE